MRSSLEFEVRLQEFVELIKSGKRMDAVKHARKHLSSNDPEQLPLIQRGMGLLAFPADTNVEPYRYSKVVFYILNFLFYLVVKIVNESFIMCNGW